MATIYQIEYHPLVVREDIPRLDHNWRAVIKEAIEQKLTKAPEVFGKPLRKSLKGYRKLRVGDYRVAFRIQKNIVKILLIEHRSIAYKKAHQRLMEKVW